MSNVTLPAARPLFETGMLYWSPLGTAFPTSDNTVTTASAYTNSWTGGWLPLGPTEAGTDFNVNLTVQPVYVAELYDPIAYRTTDRTGNFSFMLANVTAANIIKTFNGALSVVTGSGGTQSTAITPPGIGAEVRCQLGWESIDSSVRIYAPQVVNSGQMKIAFNKAPAKATLPWVGNFEIPAGSTIPWTIYTTR